MRLVSKYFDELTTGELYDILRARAAVFVVEQGCVYQDIDGLDRRALHVFLEDGGNIAAYLRAFVCDDGTVKIGRVLTLERGKGLGDRLIGDAVAEIAKEFSPESIIVDAQCRAAGFYAKQGFEVCSGEFDEDGIPRVRMKLDLRGL